MVKNDLMPKNSMMDPNDVILLLIDHQTGLFQTVKDIETGELYGNVLALAKLAKFIKMPVITTASVPDGPNGPLIPELKELLPDAIYVPRHGQINAWDNDLFKKAVESFGKKTLVMAGTLSNICLAFPAICAVGDGYTVYALMDASGCWSAFSKDLALSRMTQAGVIPTDTLAFIAEIQQTWARDDAQQFLELYKDLMPNYKLLLDSYKRAESVAKKGSQDALETTILKKI